MVDLLKQLTDNEITKALECCINDSCHKCERFKVGDSRIEHKDKMLSDALDLINRQKAEIEKKDVKISEMEYDIELMNQEKGVVQAEAIKEFAERLKGEICDSFGFVRQGKRDIDIDNLVKEMVGERKWQTKN